MQPRPRSPILIIALAAVAALFLLVSFLAQTPIGQGPLSVVVAPVQGFFNQVGRTISGLFRTTGELSDLRDRADLLQRQVTDLQAENARLREFQAEVQQLRNLHKFADDNPTYSFVGGDVIGINVNDKAHCKDKRPTEPNAGQCANKIADDSSPFVRYITINVGQRDGIKIGMPVVAGGIALVGRIGEVSYASSQVQLLTDPTSFVNVRVIESRATGTIAGNSDGTLQLQNVPQTEPMKPGDLIVTNGLGGTLPQALPVGTIERITSKELETQQTAIVRPGVDFDKLEAVLVITEVRAADAVPTSTPKP